MFRSASIMGRRPVSVCALELAIAPDQRIGRAVVLELGLRRALELGDDALGERLAQLHAPLVERIDLPDRALGEDAVLVERDQLAERRPASSASSRMVFDGRLPSNSRCGTSQSGVPSALTCFGGLAEGQRLGLGEDIGQQHVVMPAERVQGPGEGDEIAGDEPRALMDQLIEGMLAVGARLAPVDRPGVVVHARRRRASRACRCSPW